MEHHPVLHREIVEFLTADSTHVPNPIYVDGTLGGGGHAEAILEMLGQKGLYIGIDRDEEALACARLRLRRFGAQVRFVHDVFSNLQAILEREGIEKIDHVLLDLGVSSFQLEDSTRGFSFLKEGPLDMRMDLGLRQTAADLVNTLSEKELANLFFDFGEERFSRRIARNIVAFRREQPFETTRELALFVEKLVPRPAARFLHPATRVFQALRIAVNQELKHLTRFLDLDFECLNVGGRIAVISFHSLEDRLVKNAFRSKKNFKILTKKPLVPSAIECKQNPRARSAKLRVIEKLDFVVPGLMTNHAL